MALVLSRQNHVCYVHCPIRRWTAWKRNKTDIEKRRVRISRSGESGIRSLSATLHIAYPSVIVESINWLRHRKLFDLINKINSRRLAHGIQDIISRLVFGSYYLIVDNEMYSSFHLKEFLAPRLFIYYLRDYFSSVEYWRFHGSSLEPRLLKKADLVLTNSLYLKKYAGEHQENVYFIGQGCSLEVFLREDGRSEVPEDLRSISRPILGYHGAISSLRLDPALLEQIARNRPGWSIVLIGEEDAKFLQSSLHEIPNIHFLGPKPHEELPFYLAHFDICINPQALNEVTIGNYPIKVDEYLASGKRVVATHTEAMEYFLPYVRLAKGADAFLAAIDDYLAEEDTSDMREERRRFASGHSWEMCIEKLYKAISSTIIERNSQTD